MGFEPVSAGPGLFGLKTPLGFLSASPGGELQFVERLNLWEQFRILELSQSVKAIRSTGEFYVNSGFSTPKFRRLPNSYRLPPFYIAAPGYTPFSGGVIALHVLCHFMNRLGFEAYLWTDGVSGSLHTPVLTAGLAIAHQGAGRDPIAIYPEVYPNNFLNCNRVIRYILNRPGERSSNVRVVPFWEQIADRQTEFILHYAEEFRPQKLSSRLLFIPIVDEYLFGTPTVPVARDGFLIYSHRVQVSQEMIPTWAQPCTMIEMSKPRAPADLAELYKKSRGLIVFERTGARLEALMCGCPVVGIPTEHFTRPPQYSLFGNLGFGWGADFSQLQWANSTVEIFQRMYRAYANSFPEELASCIEDALLFFEWETQSGYRA